MVLKPYIAITGATLKFESDVISDGTQTKLAQQTLNVKFESDVISDGTQTKNTYNVLWIVFESDVISDGTQTIAGRESTGVHV